MPTATRFKSAHELRNIAGAAARRVLPIEIADTLPVPHRTGDRLVILILFYRESGPPNRRVVELPNHAMHLDPITGKVLRFWACRPEDVGIETPLKPVEGATIPPGMTGGEFFQKRERFLSVSPQVWEAFDSGATKLDSATTAVIREYWRLFLEITKSEVAPFYVAAASDFFGWLRHVSADR
jgi:hypothetical protein